MRYLRFISFCFKLLLVLLIILAFCVPALAENDANVHFDFNQQILSSCIFHGSIYCVHSDGISEYNIETKENTYYYFKDANRFSKFYLFAQTEKLFALALSQDSTSTLLYEISLSGESVYLNRQQSINFDDIGIGLEYMPISQIVGGEEIAIFAVQLDWSDTAVCMLNLTTGIVQCIKELEGYGITMCPYVENSILIQIYSTDSDGEHPIAFTKVDTRTGDIKYIGEVTFDGKYALTAMAANCETGDIYFLDSNRIMLTDLNGITPKLVGASLYEEYRNAFFAQEGYYVTFGLKSYTVTRIDGIIENIESLTYAASENYPEAAQMLTNESTLVSRVEYHSISDDIINLLLEHDSSIDVFILDTDSNVFQVVRDRGYALPLSESPALLQASEGMYDSLLSQLSSGEGELVGIPVSIYIDLPTMNKEAIKRLGIDDSDIPDNWFDLLDWLPTIVDRMHMVDVSLFPWDISIEKAHNTLVMQILECYELYFNIAGDTGIFTLEDLENLLNKVDTLDYSMFGMVPEVELTASNYEPSNQIPLMYAGLGGKTLEEFMVDAGDEQPLPLVLSLSPETDGYMKYSSQIAFINPYTDHPDLALHFIEALWETCKIGVHYCVIPSLSEPIPRKDYEESIAFYQTIISEVTAQMENAEEIDRPIFQMQLEDLQANLNDEVNNKWEISDAKIDWLRSNDDNLVIVSADYLIDEATMDYIEPLRQYLDGYLDASQFVPMFGSRMKIMMLEE